MPASPSRQSVWIDRDAWRCPCGAHRRATTDVCTGEIDVDGDWRHEAALRPPMTDRPAWTESWLEMSGLRAIVDLFVAGHRRTAADAADIRRRATNSPFLRHYLEQQIAALEALVATLRGFLPDADDAEGTTARHRARQRTDRV